MSEKEALKEEEKTEEIPERWKKLAIADMIDKGWRLRVKTTGDRSYITMRLGNQERSLGPYTEERWNLLLEMFPQLRAISHQSTSPRAKGSSLLRMTVSKPRALKTASNISLETLAWYEWVQSKGYPGTLGDFINEIVQEYFRQEGLVRPVIIVRETNPLVN